jgi:3-phenylpropionate/trans-cinnamate dioxygenase ferredoxin component
MSEFEQIATVEEVPTGGRKSVVIDETPALLLHIGNDFFAIEDVCTHDGQPLTDGPLNGCEITCPRHGARFDVRTGKPLCMPATEPVRTFEIELRGNDVLARSRD